MPLPFIVEAILMSVAANAAAQGINSLMSGGNKKPQPQGVLQAPSDIITAYNALPPPPEPQMLPSWAVAPVMFAFPEYFSAPVYDPYLRELDMPRVYTDQYGVLFAPSPSPEEGFLKLLFNLMTSVTSATTNNLTPTPNINTQPTPIGVVYNKPNQTSNNQSNKLLPTAAEIINNLPIRANRENKPQPVSSASTQPVSSVLNQVTKPIADQLNKGVRLDTTPINNFLNNLFMKKR